MSDEKFSKLVTGKEGKEQNTTLKILEFIEKETINVTRKDILERFLPTANPKLKTQIQPVIRE